MESEHIPRLLVRNFSEILQMVTVGQKQLFKRLLFQLFCSFLRLSQLFFLGFLEALVAATVNVAKMLCRQNFSSSNGGTERIAAFCWLDALWWC